MKNKMLIVIGGLLAALLVVGVVGATSVYAQEPTNVFQHGRGPGGGGRGFGLGDAELERRAPHRGPVEQHVGVGGAAPTAAPALPAVPSRPAVPHSSPRSRLYFCSFL